MLSHTPGMGDMGVTAMPSTEGGHRGSTGQAGGEQRNPAQNSPRGGWESQPWSWIRQGCGLCHHVPLRSCPTRCGQWQNSPLMEGGQQVLPLAEPVEELSQL